MAKATKTRKTVTRRIDVVHIDQHHIEWVGIDDSFIRHTVYPNGDEEFEPIFRDESRARVGSLDNAIRMLFELIRNHITYNRKNLRMSAGIYAELMEIFEADEPTGGLDFLENGNEGNE